MLIKDPLVACPHCQKKINRSNRARHMRRCQRRFTGTTNFFFSGCIFNFDSSMFRARSEPETKVQEPPDSPYVKSDQQSVADDSRTGFIFLNGSASRTTYQVLPPKHINNDVVQNEVANVLKELRTYLDATESK